MYVIRHFLAPAVLLVVVVVLFFFAFIEPLYGVPLSRFFHAIVDFSTTSSFGNQE